MRQFKLLLVKILSIGILSIIPISSTLAQVGVPLPTPEQAKVPKLFQSVESAIATVFNLVFAIAGVIFIILLLVGGIQYLTGAGNEETTAKARRLMVDAIVGLVITLAAFAIGTFILRAFGLYPQSGGGTILIGPGVPI